MTQQIINRNQERMLCQCHFQKPLYYTIDCCCPCIYFLHESSPNLKSHINESQRLLIPKKEKELFLKNEKEDVQNVQKKSPIIPIKIKFPGYYNKLNNHLSHNSDNLNINPINEDNNIQNMIIPKKLSTNKKNKNINLETIKLKPLKNIN